MVGEKTQTKRQGKALMSLKKKERKNDMGYKIRAA
jgi:hypothetical protein